MRVVPLDMPRKGHQPLQVFIFLISVLNIWKDFGVLGLFIQKWIQPPACWDYDLYRILSSYWLLHFNLLKKSIKVLLFFGLDYELLVFFKHSRFKEQLLTLHHFWRTVRQKRLRLVPIRPVIPTGMIRGILVWGCSELWSLFKYSKLKFKN